MTADWDSQIRILLWMPSGSTVPPGGAHVQFEKTAEALTQLGHHVRVSEDPSPDLRGVDVVHGFGLDADQVARCRTAGLPTVISTIYWSRDYRAGETGRSLDRTVARVRRTARVAISAARGGLMHLERSLSEVRSEVEMIATYAAADLLLPNAEGEATALRSDLGIATPIRVVPNGVDPTAYSLPDRPAERQGVLFVGRIEPHKNQLGLIEALRGTGLQLTIAGPVHPHHQEYARRCHQSGLGWVRFLGRVPDQDMADLYRQARVHVLPTWFETTGLVSLEAALSGCAIVTTSRGYAREYFGDLARYCDPAYPRSIRQAVLAAMDSGPSAQLRYRILHHYTWRHTAAATLAGYRDVLTSKCSHGHGNSHP